MKTINAEVLSEVFNSDSMEAIMALMKVKVPMFTIMFKRGITMDATEYQGRSLMVMVAKGEISNEGIVIKACITNPMTAGPQLNDEDSMETTIQPDGCLFNDLRGLGFSNALSIELFLMEK